MQLYHTTPRKNLTTILQLGISPTMSKGKTPDRLASHFEPNRLGVCSPIQAP